MRSRSSSRPAIFVLALQDALALHLGRVRGQHRRNEGVSKKSRSLRLDAGSLDASAHGPGCLRAARAGQIVGAAAADVVLVLGDVGQMQEIAEGAHHRNHRLARQLVEHGFQFGARGGVVSRGRSWQRRRSGGCARRASKQSSPSCSRTVSPSRRPSRRMSSRSGLVFQKKREISFFSRILCVSVSLW
jgi:hypothetical protein